MAYQGEFVVRKLGPKQVLRFNVRISKEFGLRVYLAKQLLRLAGYILGCAVDIQRSNGAG